MGGTLKLDTTPPTAEIALYAGDTWPLFPITITEADGTTPINLTGYTARFTIRARANDATAILEWSSAGGQIAVSGIAGQVTASAQPVPALAWDFCVSDLELTSSTGVVTTEFRLTLRVTEDVSRGP